MASLGCFADCHRSLAFFSASPHVCKPYCTARACSSDPRGGGGYTRCQDVGKHSRSTNVKQHWVTQLQSMDVCSFIRQFAASWLCNLCPGLGTKGSREGGVTVACCFFFRLVCFLGQCPETMLLPNTWLRTSEAMPSLTA